MATERSLKQQRAEVLESIKDLRRQMKAEGFKWDADFETKYNNIIADEERLTKEINLEVKSRELEKKAIGEMETKAEEKAQNGNVSYVQAFDGYLRHGFNGLTPEARNILSEGAAVEKRTQVAGTDSAGGFRISDKWSPKFTEYMLYYGPMLEAADVFTTGSGGKFHFPYVNDTATSANQIAEAGSVTKQDFTFAEVTLDDYTAASLVKASMQQVQDDEYDLSGFIAKNLGIRIGRQVNTKLTVGTGSSQPNGVVSASSTGKTTAGAAAITRDEIIDLIHSVDRAYRSSPKCGFMMHDLVLAYIKKLAVGSADDRPLWQPSIIQGEPDKLEGFRYWVNNDMDSAVATTNDTMLFGDFDAYKVRRIGGVFITKLNERFMDDLTYGWVGALRYDGDLVDTTAIKKLTQA